MTEEITRAVLYARVSTQEQAQHGYSLEGQMQRLREHAAKEGYVIVEEVSEPGWSGAYLERPGMGKVRELVALGEVDIVLAQDRDRFSREPEHLWRLKNEFGDHGAKLRALNDLGDDTLEGELGQGVLDQIARYQRKKLAEKGNEGKLNKARKGKIVASRTPDYGFAFSDSGESYAVMEKEMTVVRHIFELIAVEGAAIHGVKRTLEREGIPAPKGDKYWATKTIREIILDDVYKPFDRDEIDALVAEGLMRPEVARELDPSKRYGIWYFNTRRYIRRQVKEFSPDGSVTYKKRQRVRPKPRHEWIAVPVPDAGVPREHVDAAREAIEGNTRSSRAGDRVWELSGGILRCGCCGRAMMTTRQRHDPLSGYLNYYRCTTRNSRGEDVCPRTRGLRAERIEAEVFHAVRSVVDDKELVVREIGRVFEKRRRELSGPGMDIKELVERISDLERRREGYWDLAASGDIPKEAMRRKVAKLEEERGRIEWALEAAQNRDERLDALNRRKEQLLAHVGDGGPLTPKSPAGQHQLFMYAKWTPERRHELYRRMGLRVEVDLQDDLHIHWMLPDGDVPLKEGVCEPEQSRPCSPIPGLCRVQPQASFPRCLHPTPHPAPGRYEEKSRGV